MVILARICLWVSFITNKLFLRKDFDKVPHKRLMVKVKARDIGVKIWSCIDDCLRGRRHLVTLNGRESN